MPRAFIIPVIYFLFLLGFSHNLIASDEGPKRVILITSLKSPKKYKLLKKISHRHPDKIIIQRDLEKTFLKKLKKTSYKKEIYHNIDQFELSQIISGKNISGIFYVGHMTKILPPNSFGIQSKASILTACQSDVKPVFQLINPEIKFIAFCGCYSEGHIDDIKQYLEESSVTTAFKGFQGKVDAKKALKMSLKIFLGMPETESNSDLIKEPEKFQNLIEIVAVRKLDGNSDRRYPALRIVNQDKVLAMFPKGCGDSTQEVRFQIAINTDSPDVCSLKFVAESGYQSQLRPPNGLGLITFSSESVNGHWDIYRRKNGDIFGINQNIYRFTQ